jgi:hypothetical protein
MMKNITMNLKHLVLTFTLAIFAVAANAATVTYSLTTHVDGRLIEGTATLSNGANLNTITNSMPQALWRAYCTYTFYTDEAKKQQITSTLPSGVTKIYVDYVFDPPFILSQEGEGNVPTWHNIRTWNSGGENNYMLYLKKKVYQEKTYEGVFGHRVRTATPTPSYSESDPNAAMGVLGDCQWAFYGDAYSLNIKINDDWFDPNVWMQWESTTNAGNLKLGTKPGVGWQIYLNKTQKDDKSYPTMMLGVPNSDLYVNLSNVSYAIKTTKLDSKGLYDGYLKFNEHHELETTLSSKKNNMWWYGLFATPVGSGKDLNYHVTYKILKENGTWNQPDIVKPQTDSDGKGLPLSFPTEYPQRNDCDYDFYYQDAAFSTKYADDYIMQNKKNIVVYIKETLKPVKYVAEQWKTLVLPYSIDNLVTYFGEGGVRVLKYTSMQGQLNGDAFRCNLIFTPVDHIEAYQPYLFKADHVSETVLSGLRHTVENMGNPIEIFQYDTNNAPNIRVSMLGVLEEGGYTLPDDDLYFFFGSYPNGNVVDYENYTYKFYRQGGVTIPQFVCYFYVTDERPGNNAPIKASFGTESITGVSTIVADIKVQNSIYSLDGRKIDATSLDNLKRGIYIVNGRKVVK